MAQSKFDQFAQGRYQFTYDDGRTVICDKTGAEYVNVADNSVVSYDDLYTDSLRHIHQLME